MTILKNYNEYCVHVHNFQYLLPCSISCLHSKVFIVLSVSSSEFFKRSYKCSGTALAFKAVLGVFLFIGLCLLLFIENQPIIKPPQ